MRRPSFADTIAPYEVLPARDLSEGKPIVARLIGRRFEHLYDAKFERPYDARLGKMLLQNGFDFAQVPAWQRGGVGVYVDRGEGGTTHLVVDLQLPDERRYAEYVQRFVA